MVPERSKALHKLGRPSEYSISIMQSGSSSSSTPPNFMTITVTEYSLPQWAVDEGGRAGFEVRIEVGGDNLLGSIPFSLLPKALGRLVGKLGKSGAGQALS